MKEKMNFKKNIFYSNGFTLIELLAVIVLIGILSVFIISKVKSSINTSKEATYLASSESLVKSLENYYFEKKMNGSFNECEYNFDTKINTCDGFSIIGNFPDGGIITIDENGNISGNLVFENYSYSIVNNIVNMEVDYGKYVGKEYVFDYTGDIQEFSANYSGYYKLEVWGAQGGNAKDYRGGYGGYSTGVVYLNKNTQMYVVVGEQGKSGVPTVDINGGYNGGGNVFAQLGTNRNVAGGGGATHISKTSGLLSDLSSSVSNILIVAGGGGGGYKHDTSGYNGIGGDAGGYIGNNGTKGTAGVGYYGTGGTQTAAGYAYGTSSQYGAFGKGGNAGSESHGSAGGGGFYGGGGSYASTMNSGNSSGGGGSGYIGNDLLSDKLMYCYKCQNSFDLNTRTISTTNVSENPVSNYAKIGNGYAKITYLGTKNIDKNTMVTDVTNGLHDRVLSLYANEISAASNYYIVYKLTSPMSADLILYDDNFNFKLSVIDDTANIPFFRLNLVNDSNSHKKISDITLDNVGTINVSNGWRVFTYGYQFNDSATNYYIEFFGYPNNINDYQAYKPLFNKVIHEPTDIQLDDILTLPSSYNDTACRDYFVLTYSNNAQFYCLTGDSSITYVPSKKMFTFNYNGSSIYKFIYDSNWNIVNDSSFNWTGLNNTIYKNKDILDIILLSTFDIKDSSNNVYYPANTTISKLTTNYQIN